MLENKFEGGHSLASPSGASRWAICPASVRLNIGLPNKSNAAALRGTDIHQCGEMLLKGEEIIEATSVVRDGPDGGMFWANRDILTEAKAYVEYVKALATDDDAEIIAEQQVTCVAEYDITGHIDATVINGNTLHIVDLKTGRGAVNAENNLQMQLYALGALDEVFDDIEFVHMHIVQDNDMIHNTNDWKCSVEELEDFREWITERARLALQEDSECTVTDAGCQWCGYADKCQALHNKALDLITDGVDTLDEVKDIDTDEVSMEAVTALLSNKTLIDNLFKAYNKRIEDVLLAGGDVEGFKLIKGRKNKKWIDEIEAFNKIKNWLPIDEVAPRKLITPTQANKLLGGQVSPRKKNAFDKLYTVPEGELKVVTSSTRGEAIKINPEALFEDIDDDL